MFELERFNPTDFAPPWVRHQHRARYEWAALFTPHKIVVDVACGTGLAALEMARSQAKRIDAFDISEHAVQIPAR